jgi:hypothetical protein
VFISIGNGAKNRQQKDSKKTETYSTRASQVVSHPSTIQAVSSLNFPDQTREGTFYCVWPYKRNAKLSAFIQKSTFQFLEKKASSSLVSLINDYLHIYPHTVKGESTGDLYLEPFHSLTGCIRIGAKHKL